MEQNKILIVDDDPNIREVVSVLLTSEGYNVVQAENGQVAVDLVKEQNDIDLVILDIMMPGLSGVEVCSIIRRESTVPVLFLTAKSQEDDKQEAYSEGGDDYLVKPFSQVELMMKVKSLLRRYTQYEGKKIGSSGTVMLNDLAIEAKTRSVRRGEKKISLTDKEYDILQYFLTHKGEIVQNKDLYEGVWGEAYMPSAGNTIMVHVLNLRKKLEEDVNNPKIIKTVWGKGYKID